MITKLVLITDNCRDDAQRYNFPLQKAAERIITGNPGIERFEGNYYVWKKYKGTDNRLIILKHTTDNPLKEGADRVETYIFMRLLLRKSGDYNTFVDGNISQKNMIAKRSDIDMEEIDKFIKESLIRPVDNFIELRQELSDDEYSYIYDTKIAIGALKEQMVYESKEWVESIRQQDVVHDLSLICKTLGDFFTLPGQEEVYNGNLLENNIKETIVPIPQTERSILIYTLPKDKGWFLGNISTKERLETMKKDAFGFMYSDVDPTQNSDPSKDSIIIQKTRRVYPSIYLAEDSTFWNEMEIDPWGNYALSGEELRILRPEEEDQQKTLTFPLFINGRAGSGKSTILQYLFTEFFVSGLKKNIAPSLYLSYSKELIDYAIKMVRSLIIRNVDRKKDVSDSLDSRYSDDIEQVLVSDSSDNQPKRAEDEQRFINKLNKSFSESFYSFQDLLFSLIPPKFKKRFPSDKYWSFTDFKQEWTRSYPGEKKYSAAICWHIIRTYIKGWFDDEYCTPENFNDLGVDSVSKETFQWVYTNVWEKWYKKRMIEKGVWDDQDLVRFCLNPSSCYDYDEEEANDLPETFIEPRFSGIFCDESQDFTQVELAAIIGLSIFSNRKITSPEVIEKIPFVFAGDEFQTLNPTGFSWSSLRKTFTERLIYKINPRLKGADNPRKLDNNYRSSRSIVRFSNRIQLLRRILFEKEIGKDIVPQKPWDMTDNTPVLCLEPTATSVWGKLKDAKAVVIIPCEEGQRKEDYIKSVYDGKLSEIISFDENGASNDITLLTPAQAKGMEYPIVAICGFDNPEVTKVIDKLLRQDYLDITDTQKIEYKYWINNVYVAITRAKKQLIILDSIFDYNPAKHRNNFWKYSYQDSNHPENKDYTSSLLGLLSQNERNEIWKNPDEILGYMYKGTVEDIDLTNRQDHLEHAKGLYEKGTRTRDANMMGQAARRYQELGDKDSYHKCYGYMHLFNSEYEDAYKEFKAMGENTLAIESLWLKLDNHYPIISNWGKSSVCRILKSPENCAVDTTEKDFADLLNSECDSTFLIRFSDAILRLSKEIKDDSRIHDLSIAANSDIWGAVINTIISMLLKAFNKAKIAKKIKVDELQYIFNKLKDLIDSNIPVDTGGLADIAYNIAIKSNKKEFHQQCVELWETKESKERKKNYYLSLSYLQPLDDWFNFMGENSRWESNEQLSKDLFSVLREKRKDIVNFDKLKAPAKRLYTETYFNQGEEEIGFKEYAARIKNAAEYEKLISTVKEKNQNSALFCQRLKTITMIKSYIENWIDKPETKDSDVLKKKSAALIKNIETYFENTSWIKPLRTMLELCDLDMVNKLDAASYKKQSKKFCEDNLTYLTKFDQTFIPIVMNVAGCVIEKSERFISRVMFYEWARDWAKDENNKNNDYSKLIPWFDKRRAVAKYKIAEYDGNKDEIVLATKELERCDAVPKTDDDGDVVEYPDLSYLYNRLIRMDVDGKIQTPKNPPRRKKSSREIRREEKQRNSSRDDARNRKSHLKPAEPIAPAPDSTDDLLSTNTAAVVPEVTLEDVKNSIVPAETTESVPVVSVEPSVPAIAESIAEQPIGVNEPDQPEVSSENSSEASVITESDDSNSDVVSSDSSDEQESETASSEVVDSTNDDVHDAIEEPTPVKSSPDIAEPPAYAKRFKAQFRMLASRSKMTVTLDLIENGETVDTYLGTFFYDTGEFSSSELDVVDNRIVLPDGTRTPYSIIKKSKNDFVIEED